MHKSRRKDTRGMSTVLMVLSMLVLAAAQDTQAAPPLNSRDTTPAPAPAPAPAVTDVEAQPIELYEEIKVAEVPEFVPVYGGDDITVGIAVDVNLIGNPSGKIEIIVGVGSESVSIGSVQIEKIDSGVCVDVEAVIVKGEACVSGTIDDNSISFSVDLSIDVPAEDPCPFRNCQIQLSEEITCEIVIDDFGASLDCKL